MRVLFCSRHVPRGVKCQPTGQSAGQALSLTLMRVILLELPYNFTDKD